LGSGCNDLAGCSDEHAGLQPDAHDDIEIGPGQRTPTQPVGDGTGRESFRRSEEKGTRARKRGRESFRRAQTGRSGCDRAELYGSCSAEGTASSPVRHMGDFLAGQSQTCDARRRDGRCCDFLYEPRLRFIAFSPQKTPREGTQPTSPVRAATRFRNNRLPATLARGITTKFAILNQDG
jgi:hypothetical protein